MLAIECKSLSEDEAHTLIGLLERLRPTIAGLSHCAMYRALVLESLHDDRIEILTGSINGNMLGYVIAISNWRKFWWKFLQSHPVVGIRVILHRLRRRFWRVSPITKGMQVPVIASADTSSIDTRSWEDSSETIAKVTHIGVDPFAQGQGLATALYQKLIETLRMRGIRRLDAQIDLDNAPSVQLHLATGWRLRRMADAYFASIDIQ